MPSRFILDSLTNSKQESKGRYRTVNMFMHAADGILGAAHHPTYEWKLSFLDVRNWLTRAAVSYLGLETGWLAQNCSF